MTYHWIETIEAYKVLAGKWDAAVKASGEHNPFLLSDFIITWWKYHGRNRELAIFLAMDNGHVVAGIPLCVTKQFTRRVVTHIGGCHANLTHFLSVDSGVDVIDHVWRRFEGHGAWDLLVLDRVLSGNRIIGDCEKLLSSRPRGTGCSIVDAGLDGIIDLTKGYDHIIKNLPKRLRRYLRSCKEEASRMGALALTRVSGSEQVRELFKKYKDLSLRAFRARNGMSAFEADANSSFYEELLITFDKKGMLDAHRLSAGEHTLAVSFGYRFGKGFKWILTTFNPDHDALRPGHLLIDSLIQEAIAKGDPYFDMYYGGEAFYKRQWCDTMAPLKKVQIFRDNIPNRVSVWAENSLRANTGFMKLARNARQALSRVRL